MSGTRAGALLRESRTAKPTAADDFERFISKIEISVTGCWLWTGSTAKQGYAQFSMGGKPRLGHRVSYEFFIGPIPVGLQPDHLCRIRPCVNPTHLEAVTPQANTLRGPSPSARNARKTHCPAGHPYDSENTCFSGGARYCRACARAKMRARQAAGIA